MTIKTHYTIGEKIEYKGKWRTIVAIDIYISGATQSERLYLDNGTWLNREKTFIPDNLKEN